MPRWFWCLPALAALAWWPVDPYLASDDFIATAYASDFGNVVQDFVGPQYAATDVWAFYRPLITFSFWLDQALGGVGPPVGHVSNVLAHAVSALLVALVWRRFLPDGSAFGAGVLWAIMASHTGSIAWVVGRVDSHTTVWCMLTLWLCLRAQEQRGARWPVAVATAAALMSKELALVLPPLCAWLVWLREAGPLGARAAAAMRLTAPAWLVLAAYVPFRLLVLGRFGGYDASTFEPGAIARGAGSALLDLGVPLRWIGLDVVGPDGPGALFLAAAATPVAIAVLVAIARRPRLVLGAAVAWLVAVAPVASFLSVCDNPHNLRYQYLPSIAIAGVLAACNRWLVVAVALAWTWPLLAVRAEQREADLESARMHAAMLREAPALPPGPVFVQGLPHANDSKTSVQLHFGVDRMLRPPFTERAVDLRAWRPLLGRPDAVRLAGPDGAPFALPEGTTWWLPDQSALGRAPPPPPLPPLPLSGDTDGVVDVATRRLEEWTARYPELIAARRPSFGLTMPGVAAAGFRVTIFTANGYLSCWCPDHALPGDDGMRLDVMRLLAGDAENALWQQPALLVSRFDPAGPFLGDALVVPTTIDLDPSFPTLIEAGTFDPAGAAFTPTHRAERLVRLRFDRGYPAWVRRVQGR